MNEENNSVENKNTGNYSYHFNPDGNAYNDTPDGKENNTYQPESYIGGYQTNKGNALVRKLGGMSNRNQYGFRGPWNSGKVSVFVMVIILVILGLFGFALFMFR